jgi:2-polyprenyl-6-methoxyphenol hydroxylase-like FAD-dependent oxidoreductase
MAGASEMQTACCIAGGGPAGILCGYLLARAGIDVVVLEKHADFFRDFRGDTIHPSTLDVIAELGLLEEFLALPHDELTAISVRIGPDLIPFARFDHLPTRCRFLAFMPQWDLLDFLARQGRRYPGFHLMMDVEATGLIEEDGRIVGVRARSADGGALAIRAPLTIGADGRHSIVRSAAGLPVSDFGAPMDVLWFRLSRQASDGIETLGHAEAGRMMVMLDRGDYWQCAFIIPKGSFDTVRASGLERLRTQVVGMAPALAGRIGEIATWDDVKLLTVTVDRLPKWHRPGLLCIGDAAHAMSPIGGVGINLAVQDAVATANLLAAPLAAGAVTEADLAAVQQRRMFPTKVTQDIQLFVQRRIIDAVLNTGGQLRAPWQFRLLGAFPVLQRIPAYLVGVGVRPEHIGSPAAPTALVKS